MAVDIAAGIKMHWPIVQAWMDDEEIECQPKGWISDWKKIADPIWSTFYDYRVQLKIHTRWVNIYPDEECYRKEKFDAFHTKEIANRYVHTDREHPRIACVKVTYTEGEGLD